MSCWALGGPWTSRRGHRAARPHVLNPSQGRSTGFIREHRGRGVPPLHSPSHPDCGEAWTPAHPHGSSWHPSPSPGWPTVMFPSPVSVRQCQGPGTHSHPPSITDPPPQLPPIIGKDVREDRPTRSPLRATPVHLYSKVLPPVRNAGTFPHLSTGSRNLVRRPRPRQHLPCPSLLTSRWTLLLPTLALSGHPGPSLPPAGHTPPRTAGFT